MIKKCIHPKNKTRKKYCDIRTAAARSIWPTERYKISDVASPNSTLFGDFYLNVCSNPEIYLSNYYGSSWREIGATQDYCHVKGLYMCPVSYEMNNDMYLPAMPFS